MFPMVTRWWLIALLLFVPVWVAGAQEEGAATPRKTVLLISAYHADLPHNRLAREAVNRVFADAYDLDVVLHAEYLDINRFGAPEQQDVLWEFLKRRYADTKIDLVMLEDFAPLDAWRKHGAEIAPDAPVVFFDILRTMYASREQLANATGVTGAEDYVPALEWWLRIRPETREVFLVRCSGKLAESYEGPIRAVQRALGGRVKFTDLSSLPLPEIKRRVRTLPPTSVVLYQYMLVDAEGRSHVPMEVLRELAAESSAPIISGLDQYIGTGCIGGYCYRVTEQGRVAAGMALRILRGEKAGSVPAAHDTSGFVFDHAALQRYGIPLSALPAESELRNRQYSVWERYRREVTAMVAVIAGLLLTAAWLAALNRRLSRARRSLAELNESLERKVEERTAEQERLIGELQDVLARVKHLEGILPVCAFCKKIRDEDGNWNSMETYIAQRSDAHFSHGYCPDCVRKHYPGLMDGPASD